jgi:isopentenyl-diphosphate delta-isomerase type 1
MEETLILVDGNDRQIGTGLKLQVHREGLLHRAFSIFIFDHKGRLLLQRRAAGKYHSANLWTNTCCGHPRPGEETEHAAHRRLGEEMGLACPLREVMTLTYQARVPGNLIEHEFDHIYIGTFDGEPQANPTEASEWRWIEIPALQQWVDTAPEALTAWFNVILAHPACRLEDWRLQAMMENPHAPFAYQDEILPQVSRTFALTIPQLPAELRPAVANAYLLCRMADTIEDEPGLTSAQKRYYQRRYFEVISGQGDAKCLSDELTQHLTEQTLAAERELIRHMLLILAVNDTLNPAKRRAILDCLNIMTTGMAEFQDKAGLQGLATRTELDRYCYYVAGVVGETLTEFFIDFEPQLSTQRETLKHLARSFGTGLQLTNILKDQWEDRSRGVCWLPQDLLAEYHLQPCVLQAGVRDPKHVQVVRQMVGTANAHLQRALQFALLIPARHPGIRRFMVWTIGLALLTLRNVQAHPEAPSKVSRAEVAWIMGLTRLSQRSDTGLRWLYTLAARQLPFTALAPEQPSPPNP